jgi:hypothetical protein
LAHPKVRAGVTVPEAARQSRLRYVPTIDILRSYREITAVMPTTTSRLRSQRRHAVEVAIGMYGPREEVALAFLELYREDAASALLMAQQLIGQNHLMRGLAWDPTLGRLPRDLFDAMRVEITRAEYLRRVLPSAEPPLTSDQTDLASTIAEEWNGTLDSLLATARALTD